MGAFSACSPPSSPDMVDTEKVNDEHKNERLSCNATKVDEPPPLAVLVGSAPTECGLSKHHF
jgi:hypothetical protein